MPDPLKLGVLVVALLGAFLPSVVLQMRGSQVVSVPTSSPLQYALVYRQAAQHGNWIASDHWPVQSGSEHSGWAHFQRKLAEGDSLDAASAVLVMGFPEDLARVIQPVSGLAEAAIALADSIADGLFTSSLLTSLPSPGTAGPVYLTNARTVSIQEFQDRQIWFDVQQLKSSVDRIEAAIASIKHLNRWDVALVSGQLMAAIIAIGMFYFFLDERLRKRPAV